MKFFIDTANVDDIRKANDMGVICGVTTNPSLIAKEGRDFNEVTVAFPWAYGRCPYGLYRLSAANRGRAA